MQDLVRVESLISGFSSEIDPASDPDAFLVARFLHDNCFRTLFQRDAAGWSPLCYAVVRGDAFLVRALLRNRANVNDMVAKSRKDLNIPKNMPVLCMASAYHSNEVLEVLLSHRSNVNARCGHGGTALAWAAASNNAAAVGVLCKASADPNIKAGKATESCVVNQRIERHKFGKANHDTYARSQPDTS